MTYLSSITGEYPDQARRIIDQQYQYEPPWYEDRIFSELLPHRDFIPRGQPLSRPPALRYRPLPPLAAPTITNIPSRHLYPAPGVSPAPDPLAPQMGLLSPDYSKGLISFQQMQGREKGKQMADEIRTALAEDAEFFGDQPGLAGVPNPHLDRFSGGYSRTYPAAPSRQLRSSYITPGLEQQITPQKLGPAGSGSNMVGPFAQKGARDPFERYPTFSGVDRFATRPRDIPDVDVLPGSIPPGYVPTFPGGGPSGTSQLGTSPRRGAEDSYLSWLRGDRPSGWQWGEKPLTATEAYGVSIAGNMIPTHDQPRLIKGGGSFGGVAKGAAMGSPYGPYGTAIGGALGLLGAVDTKSPPEQRRTVWSRGASPGFPTQTTKLI